MYAEKISFSNRKEECLPEAVVCLLSQPLAKVPCDNENDPAFLTLLTTALSSGTREACGHSDQKEEVLRWTYPYSPWEWLHICQILTIPGLDDSSKS